MNKLIIINNKIKFNNINIKCDNEFITKIIITPTSITYNETKKNFNFNHINIIYCYNNNKLTYLEINDLVKLMILKVNNNIIDTFKYQNLSLLSHIDLSHNKLVSLQFINLPKLLDVICIKNLLTSLTFENTPNVIKLNCCYNKLSNVNIDTFKLPKLKYLKK